MVHAEDTKAYGQKQWIAGQADQRRMYGRAGRGVIGAAVDAVKQPVLGDVSINKAIAIHLREVPQEPEAKPRTQRQGKQYDAAVTAMAT